MKNIIYSSTTMWEVTIWTHENCQLLNLWANKQWWSREDTELENFREILRVPAVWCTHRNNYDPQTHTHTHTHTDVNHNFVLITPVFPTRSFICGSPPQYQHCSPQIDFLFAELCILFNHSDGAAASNIMLNTPTQWMAMWLLVYQ